MAGFVSVAGPDSLGPGISEPRVARSACDFWADNEAELNQNCSRSLPVQVSHIAEIECTLSFLANGERSALSGSQVQSGSLPFIWHTVLVLIRRRADRERELRLESAKREKGQWFWQRVGYPSKTEAVEALRPRAERYFRRSLTLGALYVTGIFSYSLLIYPHIPVQKAGGDYTKAPRICIRLNRGTKFRDCPSTLLPQRKSDEAYIELDEDDRFTYVANDHDHGGPSAWVWALAKSASHSDCRSDVAQGGDESKQSNPMARSGSLTPFCRPDVYAVNKECISGLMHFDADDSSSSKASDRCEAYEDGTQNEPTSSPPKGQFLRLFF